MTEAKRRIELKVGYKRLNTFFADYCKNISRGGTFVGTENPLPIGTEFRFLLGVPELAEPFELSGKVMWVTAKADASKANPAGMGIELQYADEAERIEIQRQVEQLMQGQLGEQLASRLLQ